MSPSTIREAVDPRPGVRSRIGVQWEEIHLEGNVTERDRVRLTSLVDCAG